MKNKNNFIVSPKNNGGKSDDAPITCIILAENCGYRMKSYGPVSMLEIKGKTLLKRQIEAIKSAFLNYEIIISVGFEARKLSRYIKSNFPSENIRIVENQIYLNSNCCESIRLCLNNTMSGNALIIPGNLYFKSNHLSLLSYNKTFVLSQDTNTDQSFELSIINNENNYLQTICFGVKNNFWSEIFFIKGYSYMSSFYNIIDNIDYKNKFSFEALNDFSRKNNVEIQRNKSDEIIKIHNIRTLKRVIK